jgi:hypothetical protein
MPAVGAGRRVVSFHRDTGRVDPSNPFDHEAAGLAGVGETYDLAGPNTPRRPENYAVPGRERREHAVPDDNGPAQGTPEGQSSETDQADHANQPGQTREGGRADPGRRGPPQANLSGVDMVRELTTHGTKEPRR